MQKILLNLLVLVSLLFTSSCVTKPEDAGISEAEINAEAAQAYADLVRTSEISKNREWNAMVQRVAGRIAKASGRNYQWEAVLIESPDINAWCMPGGKIAVYTGIMPVLKTEAALAAVMGHEVAHATLRHGMIKYARAKKGNLLGAVIGGATVLGGNILCKDDNCRRLTQIGGIAAGFALTFLDRKFSREDESGADQEGQIFMARAGYDPSESLRLWERMSAATGGKSSLEFLSTHPSDENRRAQLNSTMAAAKAEYERAPEKHGLGAKIR